MARILVTGGAGFIGSHLVDALMAQGHSVTVIDNLSSGHRKNLDPKAKLFVIDIRSKQLARLIQKIKPQTIFHLAAQKNVRNSIDDPKFDAAVNILGSLNLIEAAIQAKVKRFIFSSTGGALYGDGVPLPTSEQVQPRPESPYGIAKYTIENYLRFYRMNQKLNSISLRYANVYGPRQDPQGEAGVVAIFARQLQRGRPLIINGRGNQTRDYVYVSDVVQANLLAMKKTHVVGEINIGTGKQTSVNILAKMMQKIAKQKGKIRHSPALAGEVMKSALSWQMANNTLKWRPKVKLTEGLLTTCQWVGETI